MGMEDRDWYQEKRIDWERGGLKERKRKKRVPLSSFWIPAAIGAIVAIWLWKRFGAGL